MLRTVNIGGRGGRGWTPASAFARVRFNTLTLPRPAFKTRQGWLGLSASCMTGFAGPLTSTVLSDWLAPVDVLTTKCSRKTDRHLTPSSKCKEIHPIQRILSASMTRNQHASILCISSGRSWMVSSGRRSLHLDAECLSLPTLVLAAPSLTLEHDLVAFGVGATYHYVLAI